MKDNAKVEGTTNICYSNSSEEGHHEPVAIVSAVHQHHFWKSFIK
jgi:hypothetical protein